MVRQRDVYKGTNTLLLGGIDRGLRDEVLNQSRRMRARWKALGELESMCRSVVLETVVFVPKSAGQTRALMGKAASNEMCSMPSIFEELHAAHVVELFLIVEWVGDGHV